MPWWAGFLVLTIAGERLELARVLLHKVLARRAFVLVGTVFMAGLLLSLARQDAGIRLAGLGLLGMGGWLWRFDIARRTIRQTGVTRFITACLLPGYVWMMVGGMLWLGYGGQYGAGPVYDAMLHVIFVGSDPAVFNADGDGGYTRPRPPFPTPQKRLLAESLSTISLKEGSQADS